MSSSFVESNLCPENFWNIPNTIYLHFFISIVLRNFICNTIWYIHFWSPVYQTDLNFKTHFSKRHAAKMTMRPSADLIRPAYNPAIKSEILNTIHRLIQIYDLYINTPLTVTTTVLPMWNFSTELDNRPELLEDADEFSHGIRFLREFIIR